MDLAYARRLFGGLPVVWIASIGPRGEPHVVPLWFVWLEDALYLSCRHPSRTWSNVSRDPRVSVSVDLGRSWTELAGVSVEGTAEQLVAEHPSMRGPISAWHEKYRSLLSGDGFPRFAEQTPGLGFLRVTAQRLGGWDHARS